MYLRNKSNGDMVEVLDVSALFDASQHRVVGRFHAGEELQDPTYFEKDDMVFPSGESIPRCWSDPSYRTQH